MDKSFEQMVRGIHFGLGYMSAMYMDKKQTEEKKQEIINLVKEIDNKINSFINDCEGEKEEEF